MSDKKSETDDAPETPAAPKEEAPADAAGKDKTGPEPDPLGAI